MAVRIGDVAPDFQQHSTGGHISFHDCKGDPEVLTATFPKGWTEHKPHLRTTPQPDL